MLRYWEVVDANGMILAAGLDDSNEKFNPYHGAGGRFSSGGGGGGPQMAPDTGGNVSGGSGGGGGGGSIPRFSEKNLPESVRNQGLLMESVVGMDPKLRNAVDEYTGKDAYIGLNGNLRKGKKLNKKQQDIAEQLDRVIHQKLEAITYRGGGNSANKFLENFKEGSEFEDAGFGSTSLNPAKATAFAKSAVLFQIKTKQGAYLETVTNKEWGDKEQEVLLPRKSRFRISSIKKGIDVPLPSGSKKFTVIYVEAI